MICECTDPGCFEHHNNRFCTGEAAIVVRRIDMEDGNTTFEFCEGCAEDALDSGVFAIEEDGGN